jgi:multiple sugar transport system ATP-binding protein
MNFITGAVERLEPQGMEVRLAGGALVQVAARDGLAVGSRVTLGVRAEHMALEKSGDGIPVTVLAAELLGDTSHVYLTPDGGTTQFIARIDPEVCWQSGQMAVVRVEPSRWHVFDEQGLALT